MVRKVWILVAALMLFVQTCYAATTIKDIDFSEQPFYASADELIAELGECINNAELQFATTLQDQTLLTAANAVLKELDLTWGSEYYVRDDNRVEVLYTFTYPPGVRALKAHQTGDFSGLSEREYATYQAATAILGATLRDGMTQLETEIALHDYLTEHIEYSLSEGSEDAYGALIEGRTRCSGYADAFYLLGNMAGLNVATISGTATIAHQWNTVELDGQWYFVDVTWDDPSGAEPNHVYLNIVPELLASSHSWDPADEPSPMAEALDSNYYYIHTGQFVADSAEFEMVARRRIDERSPIALVCGERFDAGAMADRLMEYALGQNGVSSVRVSYNETIIGSMAYYQMEFLLNE